MKESVYPTINDRIITLLEHGVSPWRKTWKRRRGQLNHLGSKLPHRSFNAAMASINGVPGPTVRAGEYVVRNMPNRPWISHGVLNPSYSLRHDQVWMPLPAVFETHEDYFATLFHELGHATRHQDRLNRNPGNVPDDDAYYVEEICAEITSAFLCGVCGIVEHTIGNSAAYIDIWMKRLDDNPTFYVDASVKAKRAADYILNCMNEDETQEVPAEPREAA